MSEREFGNVFAKLAIQLRWMDADAVAIRSYFDALKDLSLEAVQASATELAREPGRRFFPTSGEWREVAHKFAAKQIREALTPARDEPWVSECAACDDTGWEPFECTGDSFCGRQKKHAHHTFVRVCACRPTNRTFQRHQRFGGGE